MPQDDIPKFVSENIIDVGIIGQEIFVEAGKRVSLVDLKLGLSKCRLAVLAPTDSKFKSITDLEGKRIATCYPTILKNKLHENYVKAETLVISRDTVKLSSLIGVADAIFDIVEDESKPIEHGMEQIYFSEDQYDTVIIYSQDLKESKREILTNLVVKIKAVLNSRSNKYILLNVLRASLSNVINILPAMESPTIIALNNPDWLAVHTVVPENYVWDMMSALKANGAENIIVLPIEKLLN